MGFLGCIECFMEDIKREMPDSYVEIDGLFRSYGSFEIPTLSFTMEVAALIRHRPHLLEAFNSILSPPFRVIIFPPRHPLPSFEACKGAAVEYVEKVRLRLHHCPNELYLFEEALLRFINRLASVAEVSQMAHSTIGQHNLDLLHEFIEFLPLTAGAYSKLQEMLCTGKDVQAQHAVVGNLHDRIPIDIEPPAH